MSLERAGHWLVTHPGQALAIVSAAVGALAIAIGVIFAETKQTSNRVTVIEQSVVPCRDTGLPRCLIQAKQVIRACRKDAVCRRLLDGTPKTRNEKGSDVDPQAPGSQPTLGSGGDRASGGSGIAPAPGGTGGGSPGGQAPTPADPPSGGGGGQAPGPGPGAAPPPQPAQPDSVVSDVLEDVAETVDGIVCRLGICR